MRQNREDQPFFRDHEQAPKGLPVRDQRQAWRSDRPRPAPRHHEFADHIAPPCYSAFLQRPEQRTMTAVPIEEQSFDHEVLKAKWT